jgi:hypothetical protein
VVGEEVSSKQQLLFLFSLPRSGSTLLQRVFRQLDEIDTAPETWLMLPYISPFKDGIQYTVYSARHSKIATNEFIRSGIGWVQFNNFLKKFLEDVVFSSGGGARFFLEKTPRNLFVAKEIQEVFGCDAKYVYLARNPVAVACSMMTTWGRGRASLHLFYQDFMLGINGFAESYDAEKHILIRYEDLVRDSTKSLFKVSEYLSIDTSSLNLSAIEPLSGIMGDPTGQYAYHGLESSRADAWTSVINSWTKVFVLRRLIRAIGAKKLEIMGYDYDDTLLKIRLYGDYSFVAEVLDLCGVIYGCVCRLFQVRLLVELLQKKHGAILR